ncbi:UNVERIFIED_ORG: hypothetical protein J2Y81_007957 [Paraburkholderia sediminicola]|nr:hypothetical protein [Paraburkholderia sediminicola]
MQPFNLSLAHLAVDRMLTISCQTIYTCTQQEVCAEIVRRAEQLIGVAFPVTHMDTAPGFPQQHARLAHVLEPAIAFLLNRYECRVDMTLERRTTFELAPCPEFYGVRALMPAVLVKTVLTSVVVVLIVTPTLMQQHFGLSPRQTFGLSSIGIVFPRLGVLLWARSARGKPLRNIGCQCRKARLRST